MDCNEEANDHNTEINHHEMLKSFETLCHGLRFEEKTHEEVFKAKQCKDARHTRENIFLN